MIKNRYNYISLFLLFFSSSPLFFSSFISSFFHLFFLSFFLLSFPPSIYPFLLLFFPSFIYSFFLSFPSLPFLPSLPLPPTIYSHLIPSYLILSLPLTIYNNPYVFSSSSHSISSHLIASHLSIFIKKPSLNNFFYGAGECFLYSSCILYVGFFPHCGVFVCMLLSFLCHVPCILLHLTRLFVFRLLPAHAWARVLFLFLFFFLCFDWLIYGRVEGR